MKIYKQFKDGGKPELVDFETVRQDLEDHYNHIDEIEAELKSGIHTEDRPISTTFNYYWNQ